MSHTLTESQKRARHLITHAMAEHSKTASDKEVLLSFEWVEVLQTIQSSMLMDAMRELRATEANAGAERSALAEPSVTHRELRKVLEELTSTVAQNSFHAAWNAALGAFFTQATGEQP